MRPSLRPPAPTYSHPSPPLGLANPAPIIQTFFLEERLSDKVRLDGVVTMVDAKHVGQHLSEVKADGVVNEAVEQIAYADRIILNKVWGLRF